MKDYFDFNLEPGKELNIIGYEKNKAEISVIIPFYNDKDYIEQSVNCILNQTYPCFELLIIDDGSKDEESLKKLEEVSKLDDRIKVFHKQNEGISATRDYGASKASEETKYLMFLDSDDLVEKTFLECAYWTLETNKDASWAYSDSVGFDSFTYTWNKWFNSERMKTINDLVEAAMVRKEAFIDVGGYELREKAVIEDWNFWLKLIAKERFPVHMSFYGEWYRRKDNGEFARATANKARALEIINKTASTIDAVVKAKQYPVKDRYNYEELLEIQEGIIVPKRKEDGKIHILMIVPWMVVGGADKFNLDLVRGLDKDRFDITIITTEINVEVLRQEFEKNATVYALNTFLDEKNWLSFINYIVCKENINIIFNTNSLFGYSILPYLKSKNPNIPILDYVHMEEWYYRNGGYARSTSMYQGVIDKTLTCNKNTERLLKETFGKKDSEVDTVYIGVDEKVFDPDKYNKKELLKKYELEDNQKKIISYVCRITEQKRPLLLLQIIKKLKEKRNDILFLIAGDGNLLDRMKYEAGKYGFSKDDIRFLGRVDNTAEIYSISDITINCSIKEGLALTSYESLSMGVPVISSDVGGQKELIDDSVGKIVPCLQDENDICLFDYKDEEINLYVDAVEYVVNNLKLCKSNARNRIINGFTIDNMCENMCKIFEDLVSNPNKDKIENGKALSKMVGITKELIVANLILDNDKIKWQSEEYQRNVYGTVYSNENSENNYKREIWKERLWSIPMYRWSILTIKKVIRKIRRNK